MSLIKWNPKKYDIFDDFFKLDHPNLGLSFFPFADQVDSSLKKAWYPAIDVSEDKDHLTIKADLPGLKKDEIDISVDNNILSIRGERKSESEKKENNYHRIERSYGMFERNLNLGTNVDSSKIKANYKQGVLEIRVPKTEVSQSKRIAIEEK